MKNKYAYSPVQEAWRSRRDLNSRMAINHLTLFKSVLFNHLSTTPYGVPYWIRTNDLMGVNHAL